MANYFIVHDPYTKRMSEANTPKLPSPVDSDGSTSHIAQDPTDKFHRAIAFGLDRIEAMSPAHRAELAQRELSEGCEEIFLRFHDALFPGQSSSPEVDCKS